MRAVIDTNVLLSGFLWYGAPHELLEQMRNGDLTPISCPALLSEFVDVISRPKFDAILSSSNTSRNKSLDELHQLAEVIEPPPLPQPVCRDSDDDAVLAMAIAGQADFIVSGDNDLLSLKIHQGIPIVTPAEAVQRIKES